MDVGECLGIVAGGVIDGIVPHEVVAADLVEVTGVAAPNGKVKRHYGVATHGVGQYDGRGVGA